jgi:outer membrane lipoprotein-sorting protein
MTHCNCTPRRREGAKNSFVRKEPSRLRAFAVCFCLLAAACAKPQLQAGPPVDAAELYARAKAAHQQPTMLACDGKAAVEAPQNPGRYALHLLAKRPGSLRIEALTPLGDPAAVLVASEGRFSLLDLRNDVFYRGPATPENLSHLIPAPLTAEEFVALLTGAIPESGEPTQAHREGDGYVLTLGGEKVWLASDMRVTRVTHENWSVTLDDHEGGVPHTIHLEAPDAKTTVDLHLRNVDTGKTPASAAFTLAPPQGMRVEDLQ